jgi:hypothetical protein
MEKATLGATVMYVIENTWMKFFQKIYIYIQFIRLVLANRANLLLI